MLTCIAYTEFNHVDIMPGMSLEIIGPKETRQGSGNLQGEPQSEDTALERDKATRKGPRVLLEESLYVKDFSFSFFFSF